MCSHDEGLRSVPATRVARVATALMTFSGWVVLAGATVSLGLTLGPWNTRDAVPAGSRQLKATSRVTVSDGLAPVHSEESSVAPYLIQPSADHAGSFVALNPAQGFRTRFGSASIQLEELAFKSRWSMGARLVGIHSGDRKSVRPLAVTPRNNRVEYRYHAPGDTGLTGWFVNDANGLAQGLLIWGDEPVGTAGAPHQRGASSLRLELAVSGGLRPVVELDSQGVELRDAGGQTVVRCDYLKACDVTGRALTTHLKTENSRQNSGSQPLVLEIDDSNAAFPVTIELSWTRPPSLAPIDSTPPTIQFVRTGHSANGKAYLEVEVQDAESGLASVVPTVSRNCVLSGNVVQHYFENYSSKPGRVRVCKSDSTRPAQLALTATNGVGLSTTANPVIVSLELGRGKSRIDRTFKRISALEHWVTLENGAAGLADATVMVNGRLAGRGRLENNASRVLNIAPLMKPGNKNEVRVIVTGSRGAAAVMVVADAPATGKVEAVPVTPGRWPLNQEWTP